MGPAMQRLCGGGDAAEVADIGAAVSLGIRVDYLAIVARARRAHPVTVTHHRRGVDHEDDDVALLRFAHEADDAVGSIAEIDPFEALVGVVQLPERGLTLI